MPIGRGFGVFPLPSSSMRRRNLCWRASMTAIAPSFSSDTYALEPSGRNPIDRGLGPTGMRRSILLVCVSMANTAPSPSLVTYTTRPSGRIVTPSGSSPIFTAATTAPDATSTTLTVAASSLAT